MNWKRPAVYYDIRPRLYRNRRRSNKKGAYDFIQKPPDLNRLLLTVRNALDKSNLVTETKTLRKKVARAFDIVGESEPIATVKETID